MLEAVQRRQITSDLPAEEWSSVGRITVVDSVVPEIANPPFAAIEQRTEELRSTIGLLIQFCNVLDTVFVRKDGSVAKDSTTGMTDDLLMGDDSVQNQIHNLQAGLIAIDSLEAINADQVQTIADQIANLAVSLTNALLYSITADISDPDNLLLKLVNDAENPGIDKVYGTDGPGTKGWQAITINLHP